MAGSVTVTMYMRQETYRLIFMSLILFQILYGKSKTWPDFKIDK